MSQLRFYFVFNTVLCLILKPAYGALKLEIRHFDGHEQTPLCHELTQAAHGVVSLKISQVDEPGNCSCGISYIFSRTLLKDVNIESRELKSEWKYDNSYRLEDITYVYLNYGFRGTSQVEFNGHPVPIHTDNYFNLQVSIDIEDGAGYPSVRCSRSERYVYDISTTTTTPTTTTTTTTAPTTTTTTTTARSTSSPATKTTHVAYSGSQTTNVVPEMPSTVNSKTDENKSIFSQTFVLTMTGAVGLVILIILVIVIVCVVRKRPANGQMKKKASREPNSGVKQDTHEHPMTGPEYANVPNHNQEFGVEYAEINMNLLAPKPEKKFKENDTDNETAPLVYADLAFYDNTESSRISPKAEATRVAPAEDNESNVQLYEDDIAAVYSKPVKKNKQ